MAQQTRSYWKNGAMNFFDDQLDTTWKGGVWADCPLLAIRSNPHIGYIFEEDFTNYQGAIADANPPTMTNWTATQYNTTGGLALQATTGLGGILVIDGEGGAQHDGMQLQHNLESFQCAADKDLWYECAFRSRDHLADVDMFVGLAELGAALMANGDLAEATYDYIGLAIETTAAPAAKIYCTKDGVEASDTGLTIVDNTWYRMGFKVKGVSTIEFFIDGVSIALTNITPAVIPTNPLTLSFISGTDAASDPILDIDWIRAVQLR